MTNNGTTTERLNRMEDNQEAFAEAIKEIKEQLEKQNQKLDILNQKFDELSGAKKALIWITGVAISIAAIVNAYVNGHK